MIRSSVCIDSLFIAVALLLVTLSVVLARRRLGGCCGSRRHGSPPQRLSQNEHEGVIEGVDEGVDEHAAVGDSTRGVEAEVREEAPREEAAPCA